MVSLVMFNCKLYINYISISTQRACVIIYLVNASQFSLELVSHMFTTNKLPCYMQSLNLIWGRNVRKKKECKEKMLPCFKRNNEII